LFLGFKNSSKDISGSIDIIIIKIKNILKNDEFLLYFYKMKEKSYKKSIKNWHVNDRPREKLLNKGKNTLSEAELIAILIGSGNKDESAVELAKKILTSVHNNLNDLGKLSVHQ